MKYNRKQKMDLQMVMGADEPMLPLLPLFKPSNGILNPWGRELASLFARLKLKKGMTVLDIPCGQGGNSVPLAAKYGVRVKGYDLVPEYTRFAADRARRMGVSRLCRFKPMDVRDVVRRERNIDVLLWNAPPHVWGRAKSTMKTLRKTVRKGGLIVIGDAYLHAGVKKSPMFKDYEPLKEANKGYTAWGDRMLEFTDFKNTLWKFDYNRTRREVCATVGRAKTEKDKNVIRAYLASMDEAEKTDAKFLGLALWILRVTN